LDCCKPLANFQSSKTVVFDCSHCLYGGTAFWRWRENIFINSHKFVVGTDFSVTKDRLTREKQAKFVFDVWYKS
jgi:hypothetical protein